MITEIRNCVPADRDRVINLWNCVFPESTGHNLPQDAIDRKMAVDDKLFFVACQENGDVVGTVVAGYDGHRGWLYSVAVAPDARRLGIGSCLVRHAEAELAKRGCPKINLQVRANNAGVTAFYESLGFRLEERISMGKVTTK